MAQRGRYAKGDAKRQEILSTALRLVGEKGYSNATLREIAEETGLSKNGLLHHFGSKEELFAEIVIHRDEVARERYAEAPENYAFDSVADHVSRFAKVTGLTQLYVRLSAEAIEPRHPAHPYFTERYESVRAEFVAVFGYLRDKGELRDGLDPESCATLLIAVLDGLQTQWLYNPDIDMVDHVRKFFSMVGTLPAEVIPDIKSAS